MKKFKGVITALITPFFHEEVDESSLTRLLEHQLDHGVEGFVVNGTTAESPTLKPQEVEKIFNLVKSVLKKQSRTDFPIIVGTGSNSTEHTIELTRHAEAMGADAALVVVPYYNNPPQRGLIRHFSAVADASRLPVILYNVPGRTVAKLELSTIVELSKHPNIVGIKEASGNMELAREIRQQCKNDFALISGDDGTYDEFAALGGDGVISVASHVIPEAMRNKQARQYAELIKTLFCEANPIPVKRALFEMGLIRSPEMRLPLVELRADLVGPLKEQMVKAGVLK